MHISNDTLVDKVSLTLREQIVSGLLPAGTPLKQEELSGRFGISMGALREAFRALHSEGLVTIAPRRGAVVSSLSAAEARELFEIRTFLELGALELALPAMTQQDVDSATAALSRLEQVSDSARWPEFNREFHERLYRPAGRPKLLSFIRVLHDNVSRYMRLYLDTMNFQQSSQAEHQGLLEACRRKDLPLAQQTLREHMRNAGERLVAYLESEQQRAVPQCSGGVKAAPALKV